MAFFWVVERYVPEPDSDEIANLFHSPKALNPSGKARDADLLKAGILWWLVHLVKGS